MPASEKVPRAMAPRFAAITALTDAFCDKHLNDEYRALIHRVVGSLARKRPSPLLKGREEVWAAAAVHAVGRMNFLDDPSQKPHMKMTDVDKAFGVSSGTGQGRSKTIRDMLKMRSFDPEWTLPSRIADNPMAWLIQVDGFMMDARHAPREIQEEAFRRGLIPYIPGGKDGSAEAGDDEGGHT